MRFSSIILAAEFVLVALAAPIIGTLDTRDAATTDGHKYKSDHPAYYYTSFGSNPGRRSADTGEKVHSKHPPWYYTAFGSNPGRRAAQPEAESDARNVMLLKPLNVARRAAKAMNTKFLKVTRDAFAMNVKMLKVAREANPMNVKMLKVTRDADAEPKSHANFPKNT